MRQMEILDLAGNPECTQSQSQGTLANGPQLEKAMGVKATLEEAIFRSWGPSEVAIRG
jgi:hypothetical protein